MRQYGQPAPDCSVAHADEQSELLNGHEFQLSNDVEALADCHQAGGLRQGVSSTPTEQETLQTAARRIVGRSAAHSTRRLLRRYLLLERCDNVVTT